MNAMFAYATWKTQINIYNQTKLTVNYKLQNQEAASIYWIIYYLMCKSTNRNTKCPGQPKISKL